MKKYSLIMFLLIFPILAYSQKPEDFKVVYDVGIETVIKPGTALYPFDKHLYVTGSPNTEQIGNRLIRINLLHETRVYEYKNTKTHPYVNDCASEMLAMMTWLGQENILKSKKNYFIGGEYGYLVFNEEETNVDSITFSHYINAGYTSLSVINSTGDYIYQIKTGIKKIKTETFEVVDSILYEKNSTTRSLFGDMYQSPHDRLFIDENGIMWIPIKNRNYYYIHTFDTKVWDATSYSIFNIKEKINYEGDGKVEIKTTLPYRENNRFKIFLLTLDEVDSSNKTLIIRKHPDGKFDTTITYPDKFHKNKLITHTTEAGFDSILFSDARQMLEGTNAQFQKMYKWSENEVALCSIAYGTKQDSSTMLIYNIDTKEWNKFILPDFIVFTPFGVIDNELISISEWNNRHYFLTRSKLYVYEPNNSIEDNTEPAIIKNYSLFPNPAGDDCTLSMDLAEAGSISISLSDMLGRDIMQIYDGYADAGAFTKAFNTKHLACGVYSVIIRIGDKINVEKLIINR